MSGTCCFRESVATTVTLAALRDHEREAIYAMSCRLAAASALCLRRSLGDIDDGEDERATLLQCAEELHARVRGRLMDCADGGSELEAVTAMIRSVEDVSFLLHNITTIQRLRKLLVESTEPISVGATQRCEALLAEMLCHADKLAIGIASALDGGTDRNALMGATRSIQGVRACFVEAERATFSLQKRWRTTGDDAVSRPFQKTECRSRMIRAALRSLLVCAESLARIAARQVPIPAHGESVSTTSGMPLRPLPAPARTTVYTV